MALFKKLRTRCRGNGGGFGTCVRATYSARVHLQVQITAMCAGVQVLRLGVRRLVGERTCLGAPCSAQAAHSCLCFAVNANHLTPTRTYSHLHYAATHYPRYIRQLLSTKCAAVKSITRYRIKDPNQVITAPKFTNSTKRTFYGLPFYAHLPKRRIEQLGTCHNLSEWFNLSNCWVEKPQIVLLFMAHAVNISRVGIPEM